MIPPFFFFDLCEWTVMMMFHWVHKEASGQRKPCHWTCARSSGTGNYHHTLLTKGLTAANGGKKRGRYGTHRTSKGKSSGLCQWEGRECVDDGVTLGPSYPRV